MSYHPSVYVTYEHGKYVYYDTFPHLGGKPWSQWPAEMWTLPLREYLWSSLIELEPAEALAFNLPNETIVQLIRGAHRTQLEWEWAIAEHVARTGDAKRLLSLTPIRAAQIAQRHGWMTALKKAVWNCNLTPRQQRGWLWLGIPVCTKNKRDAFAHESACLGGIVHMGDRRDIPSLQQLCVYVARRGDEPLDGVPEPLRDWIES